MIRVTGGEYRGRKIRVPKGVRPTSDRVREAIFNVLGEKVVRARCLDLFAGSGALGIEALSRGAFQVVFCEASHRVARTLRENLERLGIQKERYEIRCSDVSGLVDRLAGEEQSFGVVLIDPPYSSALYQAVMLSLGLSGIVEDGGVVVVERSKKNRLGSTFGNLVLLKTRQYGDTVVDFFVAEKSGERG